MQLRMMIGILLYVSFASANYPSVSSPQYETITENTKKVMVLKVIDSKNKVIYLYLSTNGEFKEKIGGKIIDGVKFEWEVADINEEYFEESFFLISKQYLSCLSKKDIKKMRSYVIDADINQFSEDWYLPYLSYLSKL